MSVRASEFQTQYYTTLGAQNIDSVERKIYLGANQSSFFALEFLRQSPR